MPDPNTSNSAREIDFLSLVRQADPKPEKFIKVYDFRHPKYERDKAPGEPYGQ